MANDPKETTRVQTTGEMPPKTTRFLSSNALGEKIAKIGTVLSAIMASACCWLPLLLLAVGVSGAGIAATLETYRPLFIVATLGFLGAAFYFTYRPKKATAAAGHGCCATEPAEGEACCAPTGNRCFNMMALNKVMLWVVTVLAVAFLFFPSYVGLLFGTGNDVAATENMNRAVFQIDGMTCEGCATTVATAIRQVPGVSAVEVSYEKRQAIVGTDACCAVPKDKILAALEMAGYSGTFVETNQPAASSGFVTTQPGACCVVPQLGKGNGDAASVAANGPEKSTTEPVVQSAQCYLLAIEGMTCKECAGHVEKALAKVPGVAEVHVDFAKAEATVCTKPGAEVSVQTLIDAVRKTGYKAKLKK